MAQRPRFLVPLILVSGLVVAGVWVDRQRASNRTQLSGVFESQPTTLASRSGGRVVSIRVHEGDAVDRGAVLIELEATPESAGAAAANALADQAEARLQELRSGTRREQITRQEQAVSEARAALARAEHGPLPEEIAAARETVVQAEAKLSMALTGPRPEDKAQAAAAERQALAAYDAAKRGPTAEERAQWRARLDAATTQAKVARAEAQRKERLYESGVVSLSDYAHFEALARTAEANQQDVAKALERAERGTPPEELEEAHQAYLAAHARFLSTRRSRPEEIQIARAALRSAQSQLALLVRGSRAEDLAILRARVAQATAVLDELKRGTRAEQIIQARGAATSAQQQARGANARASEAVVKAPIAGTVERIVVSTGDLVPAGAPLLRMSDPSEIWMRVYVPESSLAKVTVGARAVLHVDGIDGDVAARVESIASQGEFTPANIQTPEERVRQVFAVRLRLEGPEPRIRAGIAASVRRIGEYIP